MRSCPVSSGFKEHRVNNGSRIHRLSSALERCALKRTTHHKRTVDGTFPVGFRIGPLVRGWFEHELDQWNRAIAAGATDDELRELCKRIVAARRVNVAELIESIAPNEVPA
jgi:predicted DNA-binding transcriptional regulator AlpA